MTSPQHICPKCKQPHTASLFTNDQGRPAKWCAYCRLNYRERLTRLHQRDATKPRREEANDASNVATREGYANHPLASLLALSHIAGAKRALAIRDGKSWRGKKAWGEYYRAKQELGVMLKGCPHCPCKHRGSECCWCSERRPPQACPVLDEMIKRDPNSSGVS